jgi:hypothetical protein
MVNVGSVAQQLDGNDVRFFLVRAAAALDASPVVNFRPTP